MQALFQRGWAVAAGERYRIRTPPAIRVTVASLDAGDTPAFADDDRGTAEWLRVATELHTLAVLPVTIEIAVRAAELHEAS
ncbi:MAG: hypothetical protein M3P29_10000 [Acidobacteriota bacterium]|nr:hypothetical protein [Acidobacteriota bacterium]